MRCVASCPAGQRRDLNHSGALSTLLTAAYNRFVDLTLEPPQRPAAAAATCELALLGKDGIWLMQVWVPAAAAAATAAQVACPEWGRPPLTTPLPPTLPQIPRRVPHVLLPPGGRADVLVRCMGQPGAEVRGRPRMVVPCAVSSRAGL